MTYQEVEHFLFTELASYQEKGSIAFKGNLDNAKALAQLTGMPHQKIKTIHVAGTNGKGSVSHIIAAGLQVNGYKVGLFTSPHYKTYRERIKINGELISETSVVQFIEQYKQEIQEIGPSFFEITSTMALHYFAQQNVDVAVIEVGLGGRLDSTNIILPVISVITNISYDHQKILGNTLPKIATEKAGIIKENVPVVIGEFQKEVEEVFLEKAKFMNAPISFAELQSHLHFEQTEKSNQVKFEPKDSTWQIELDIDFQSSFFVKNLKTALYVLCKLSIPFNLDPAKVAYGIQNISKLTYFIGRWMVLKKNPLIIMDSAHNEAGVKELISQIKKQECNTLRIVWGTTKEKDVDAILKLLPKNAQFYFCKADNSRAMDAEELFLQASTYGLHGFAYNSVKSAYRIALAESNSDDIILIAGSSFVVAEIV